MAQRHDDQVVLFRARENIVPDKAVTKHRDFEEKLVAMLSHDRRMSLTIMPHLYDLKADGHLFERLRAIPG